jgi:hypothetical protein
MPSAINADNGVVSGTAGLKSSADNSGVLDLQTNGTTAISISASQVVTFANQPAYTGGTANGVLYLNASKVLTSGSALTFNGTSLRVGTTSTYNGEMLVVDSANGNFSYNSRFVNSSTTNTNYCATTWSHGQSGTAVGYLGVGGSAVGNASFANNFVVGTQTSSALVFNTADVERARISAGGNFGIGTSSPSTKLHVAGSITVDSSIIFSDATTQTTAPGMVKLASGSISSSTATLDINLSAYSYTCYKLLIRNIQMTSNTQVWIDKLTSSGVTAGTWYGGATREGEGAIAQVEFSGQAHWYLFGNTTTTTNDAGLYNGVIDATIMLSGTSNKWIGTANAFFRTGSGAAQNINTGALDITTTALWGIRFAGGANIATLSYVIYGVSMP